MDTYVVTLKWLIDRRVILIQPGGDFDVSVALDTVKRVKRMVNEGQRPIHMLINTTVVRTPAKDPHPLGAALLGLRQHPNLGALVFVYTLPQSRIGGELLARFLGMSFQVAESSPRAVEMLRTLDPSLNGLEPDWTI